MTIGTRTTKLSRLWDLLGFAITIGLLAFGSFSFLAGDYAKAACFLIMVLIVDGARGTPPWRSASDDTALE